MEDIAFLCLIVSRQPNGTIRKTYTEELVWLAPPLAFQRPHRALAAKLLADSSDTLELSDLDEDTLTVICNILAEFR